MKIAVIGATGMIGHHTANAVIERNHELIILRRSSSNTEKLKDLVYVDRIVDFNDRKSITQGLIGVDAVIHCGAYYPTIPRYWKEDVKLASEQMENFYEACKDIPLHKIVYVGAAIALPKHPEGENGTEEMVYSSTPQNKNPYLQVKYELEEMAKQYASKGLPVVIGIPSMCFGEYDYGPSTGRLIVDISNENLPAYIEGNRNVIYAGDAGRGLVMAAEKGRISERYLFTGTNVSMKNLTKLIADLSGVEPPKKKIPLPIAKVIAHFLEFKAKIFKEEKVKLDSTAVAVMALGQFLDGSKARHEFGFTQSETLEETIKRSLTWFFNEGYINKRDR
ncbi:MULTISPECIES: NAD-dependent epimerase/dehydratase family protein [unclassified Bacillus (in: firmicutes)]|uniref:NAD-dependent epimerase/dehydratase family protein n=1 Tax=unclassified Bacillus (in: firmicutes) TaxID=185979 RepID=UPI0008EA4B46|nr:MULTISPECIES: NAD-dependent epimerase/dehydratase family protein [unclassified Bacillus (in: firmicutes)]SFA81402.1 dihydroflavonol-4-reductase [Bacillus sp. UNCCL13]SFQ71490.1 dihydroflavonol-4-reductase [Bacillus sp. cl95]